MRSSTLTPYPRWSDGFFTATRPYGGFLWESGFLSTLLVATSPTTRHASGSVNPTFSTGPRTTRSNRVGDSRTITGVIDAEGRACYRWQPGDRSWDHASPTRGRILGLYSRDPRGAR